MEWHSQEEQPNVPQVICKDNNGKIKVCGVKHGDFAPYDWVTAAELIREVKKLEFALEQFSNWETEECPGGDCPYAQQVIERLDKKGMTAEQIAAVLKTCDPEKIGCGVKKDEICYCWTEKYKLDYGKKH
jgi:hypothetical protein